MSIYKKSVMIFAAIMVASFLIFGGITLWLVTDYSSDSQRDQISQTAMLSASYIEQNYRKNGTRGFNQYVYYSQEELLEFLKVAANETDHRYGIICDRNGNVLLSPENSVNFDIKLSEKTISAMLSDEGYYEFTSLDGMLYEKHFVSSFPISSQDGLVSGFLIICSSSAFMHDLFMNILRITVLATLVSLAVVFVLLLIVSKRFTNPLRKIGDAARDFASGKFDARIPVNGKGEIAELAVAFNNMATSLEQIENTRRAFLSNVSHELRTPMATISGFVDGMLSGAIKPENYEHYLSIISGEVKRLSRLIGTILDITRIQSGEKVLNVSPFDICETARIILISFEQQIEQRKLDVEFECDKDNICVSADPDAIYRVAYNLIENAIKYAKDGGKLKVSILKKDKKVFVSVYNEGEGIRQEELPNVFERFYKIDHSHGLDKSGLGLGLNIVKAIIDLHGEEIFVKSKFGEYCEFVFTLTETTQNGK